ncbi:MAG: hypothetical protein ACT443_08650 [Gemmatimonadota bacterium]
MLRVAMLALGASLTAGALAPQEAAAQLSGRERAEAERRGGVIVRQDDRRDRDSRVDGRRDGRDRDELRRLEREYRARRDHDRRDDRRRYDCDADDDDDFNRGRASRGSGPPFCRNGRGHPVHGMSWCRQKGWEDASLRNAGWRDIILRRPRTVAQSDLGRSILLDILGSSGYGRFDQQRSRLGLGSSLTGRWYDSSDGSLLNLFAGGIQVARILDRDRDGRADVVLLNYGR